MQLTPNETYRQSMKSTAEIQRDLDLIRLAYRERDFTPANQRRIQDLPWLVLGMAIGSLIALFLYF